MTTTTTTTWTERMAAALDGEDALCSIIEAGRVAQQVDDGLTDDLILTVAVHVDFYGAESHLVVRWFVAQLGWSADFAAGLNEAGLLAEVS